MSLVPESLNVYQNTALRTMPSNSLKDSNQLTARSILSVQVSKMRSRSSLRTIWHQEGSEHPSLPWHLLSSLSKKRMVHYDQFRITENSMTWRSRTSTPCHWSKNSLTRPNTHASLPNLISNGVIITSGSRKVMSGRQLSGLIKDSSNQRSCSLVSPTPLPHSKVTWMKPSGGLCMKDM